MDVDLDWGELSYDHNVVELGTSRKETDWNLKDLSSAFDALE